MTGMSSWRLPLKMRSTSVAHRLNSFQSSFGAPRSSQMIGIGYGSQMSTAMSARPRGATSSTSPSTTSRMNGRSRSAARGEKARPTSRRNRVCSSPSADRIEVRRRARYCGSVMPDISMIRDVALCQRLSRSMATTSS